MENNLSNMGNRINFCRELNGKHFKLKNNSHFLTHYFIILFEFFSCYTDYNCDKERSIPNFKC